MRGKLNVMKDEIRVLEAEVERLGAECESRRGLENLQIARAVRAEEQRDALASWQRNALREIEQLNAKVDSWVDINSTAGKEIVRLREQLACCRELREYDARELAGYRDQTKGKRR